MGHARRAVPPANRSVAEGEDDAVDKQFVDNLAKRLADAVPSGMRSLQGDLERNFRGLLQSGLAKLDLVTREEFDVQARVLERTREKLTCLEDELKLLQRQLHEPAPREEDQD